MRKLIEFIATLYGLLVVRDSLSGKNKKTTVKVGRIHKVLKGDIIKERVPETDGDDLVLDCGCIGKYKNQMNTKTRTITSTHTSTILCSSCQKEEDNFKKIENQFK